MKKILIVDDDKPLADLYRERLEIAGYKVSVLYDGKDVKLKVLRNIPDLILLDIMLPVVRGDQVLEELKADNKTKDIPVIILTALSQIRSKNPEVLKMADRILVKSEVLPMDLLKIMDRILAKK